jgi:hypothetical protein
MKLNRFYLKDFKTHGSTAIGADETYFLGGIKKKKKETTQPVSNVLAK